MKPKKSKPKGKITSKAIPTRVVFNPHNNVITDTLGPLTKSRHGKYAHYCYDWDELLIDENDPEFEVCNCGKPNAKT